MDKFKCGICGKTFKSESGLVGHMRLTHDTQRIKTTPDQIGKRLEALELAGASNPGQKVDSEEGLIATLRLLLPVMQRFKVVVVPFVTGYDTHDSDPKDYHIFKNATFYKSGTGGAAMNKDAVEV